MAADKNHFWREEETAFMLTQMKQLNILNFLDGRKNRNAAAYKKVEVRMREAGFLRTVEQIRCRWKVLRIAFLKARSSKDRRGLSPAILQHLEFLDELLGHRSLSPGDADGGSESLIPPVKEDEAEEAAVTPLASSTTTSSGAVRRRRRVKSALAEHHAFLQRLQEEQNSWQAEQSQLEHERLERLITTIVSTSEQSMDRLANVFLDTLRNMLPMTTQAPGVWPFPKVSPAVFA